MDHMTPAERMTWARYQLIATQPFFGALALGMRTIAQPGLGTMATDGKSIAYDPAFVAAHTPDEVVGVIAHEVMHAAQAHHLRRGGRDPELFNVAADYAVNPIVKRAGFTLPKEAPSRPEFDGLIVEEIYDRLAKEQGGRGKKPGPQPQGSGAPSPSPAPRQGQPDPNGQPGQNPPTPDPGGCGAVKDLQGADGKQLTESERQAAEVEQKIRVVQAAHAAKSRGMGSADIDRMIEELLEPKLDWRVLLRDFFDRTAKNDFSWHMPNARYMASGLYLPTLRSAELGDVAIMVDTSGSIDKQALADFAAEMRDIFELCQPRTCYVIYCDDKVKRVDTFERGAELELHAIGGGGTDFAPPFEWLAKNSIEPQCAVYLTDLMGSFPADPGYPILWAVKGDAKVAPIGEVIPLAG